MSKPPTDAETIQLLLLQAFEYGQMHPITTNNAVVFDAWYEKHKRQLCRELRTEISMTEVCNEPEGSLVLEGTDGGRT